MRRRSVAASCEFEIHERNFTDGGETAVVRAGAEKSDGHTFHRRIRQAAIRQCSAPAPGFLSQWRRPIGISDLRNRPHAALAIRERRRRAVSAVLPCRVKALRATATFAVMYWYYTQLELLGKEGRARPDMSVFAATRRVMALQKQLLAERNS